MKTILNCSLILFLVSCAHVTPKEEDTEWKKEFIVKTSCVNPDVKLKRIQSTHNFLGVETNRIYAFTCGSKRYSCELGQLNNTCKPIDIF